MAVNETQFKAEIKLACKHAGIKAISLSPEYEGGISDLLIKGPGFPATMLELKWLRTMPSAAKITDITPRQAQFLRTWKGMGGNCAVLAGYPIGPRLWEAGISYQFNEDAPYNFTWAIRRAAGDDWPVLNLMGEIDTYHAR